MKKEIKNLWKGLHKRVKKMTLEEDHIEEERLREKLKRIGKLPKIIYSSTNKAIEEYNKILIEEMHKRVRK